MIDWNINKGYKEDKTSMILSTDLSSAYNCVDHCILLRKMQYYGIRGKELEFFKSYLKGRSQYVELDTKKSHNLILPPCGVVQGSKLSTTFIFFIHMRFLNPKKSVTTLIFLKN